MAEYHTTRIIYPVDAKIYHDRDDCRVAVRPNPTTARAARGRAES
jgi:hypothetical protein